jgi:phosphoserine phosphatase
MTRLHIFDMDGTLLHGAASVELSRHLGAGIFAAADAVERSWVRGEISDTGFWEAMLPLWVGVTESQIDGAFTAAPWIDGLRGVFADISARGEVCAVISQSPLFFVRRLEQWGAHRTFGTRVAPGVAVTDDQLLTVRDKVDITLGLLEEFGLDERACVAYGDSSSDVLLFDHLRHTVGVNCKEVLRERSAAVYDGADLREAYALGRSLLDGTPAGCPR